MKALIKFLPVEGEIEENDFIINCGNLGKVISIGKHATKVLFDYPAEPYVPITNSIFKKTAKKVKPFLVTQDKEINKGDKMVTHEGIEVAEYNGFSFDKGGEYCYKILGEASPEATFVKDGKEYEVNEIDVNTQDTGGVLGKYITVACPCCGDFK